MKIRLVLLSLTLSFLGCTTSTPTLEDIFKADNLLWLEERQGERAKNWVERQNGRVKEKIMKSKLYKRNYKTLLKLIQNKNRVPKIQIEGKYAYTLNKDSSSSKGSWVRILLSKIGRSLKKWEVVIDFDHLSKLEGKGLNFYEARCLKPASRFCLISISPSGGDSIEIREFDTRKKVFVKNGFRFSENKQIVSWLSLNDVAISKKFKGGIATQSGFGTELRVVRRGQKSSASKTLMTVPKNYFTIIPYLFPGDNRSYSFASRYHSVGKHDEWLFKNNQPVKIDIPNASPLLGVIDGYLLISIGEPWKVKGAYFAKNSILAIEMDGILSNKSAADYNIKTVYVPKNDEYLSKKTYVTKNYLILNPLQNVKGRIKLVSFKNGQSKVLKTIDFANQSLEVVEVDYQNNTAYFTKESFISPTSLYSFDIPKGQIKVERQGKRTFNNEKIQVKQFFAKSHDGIQIPFFIMGKSGVLNKGNTPTILKGYGAYGHSLLPNYDSTYGKLWLEKGGVYAIANVRGGGELGPEWHKSGTKTDKVNSVLDFIAVAEKIIKLKISNSKKLGIYGGSLGGQVIGGAMALKPELFQAVVAVVPVLDLLRGHEIGGGSWMGEVGDPKNKMSRKAMLKYSPYHNLDSRKVYPSFLGFSRNSDDRVHPGHARKFTAKLQNYGADNAYYYEAGEGGHGSGNTTNQTALWKALQMTFFANELGL